VSHGITDVTTDHSHTGNNTASGHETPSSTSILSKEDEISGSQDIKELTDAVSETFESIDGPQESLKEVLQHQGITSVSKVNSAGSNGEPPKNVLLALPTEEDELEIVLPSAEKPRTTQDHPKYVYDVMNKYTRNFEPPSTSEMIGPLLQGMMSSGGAGGGGGAGGLGNMLQMMNTMNRMKSMFGGGASPTQAAPSGGLGMLGSLLGGGGGAGNSGGGSSGGGGLMSMLGPLLGGGNRQPSSGGGTVNQAPPPSGQPVRPPANEPSLADLLGVDPSTVGVSQPAAPPRPAANNPLASLFETATAGSVQGSSAGGSKLGTIMKFAPMAMGGLGMMSKMFGGKKNQQMPPGMQGMPPGMQGMPPGMQQGMPPGMQQGMQQFGQQQQGQAGAFPGMPGQQPFGMQPQQGQGMFGQQSQFGAGLGLQATPAPNLLGAAQGAQGTQQILQQLQQAQAQIAQLQAKLNNGNAAGGFGSTGSSLFGASATPAVTPGISSTLTNPTNPFSLATASNDHQHDLLLSELIKQNQLLMQQNQQFMSNLATVQRQPAVNPMAVSGGTFGQLPQSGLANSIGINPAAGQQLPNTVQPSNNFMNSMPQQNSFPSFTNNGMAQNSFPQTNPNPAAGGLNMFGGGAHNTNTHGATTGGAGGVSNPFMTGAGGAGAGQMTSGSSMSGMFGPSAPAKQNTAGSTGGGGLSSFIGGGGSAGGGPMAGLSGLLGGGGGGGGGSPLAGLLGGGGGGGGGGSPLAGLLGGGGGGGSGGNPLAGLLGGGGGMDFSKFTDSLF